MRLPTIQPSNHPTIQTVAHNQTNQPTRGGPGQPMMQWFRGQPGAGPYSCHQLLHPALSATPTIFFFLQQVFSGELHHRIM